MNSLQAPLEIHDLTVSYNRRPVLYGIDLEIQEGTLVGVIGPNGAGKSTLIKTIMGLVPATGGWVAAIDAPWIPRFSISFYLAFCSFFIVCIVNIIAVTLKELLLIFKANRLFQSLYLF